MRKNNTPFRSFDEFIDKALENIKENGQSQT